MSACVEQMFCVREKPWHGLGTVVKEAPTSEEAIKLAGLDWDVDSRFIYDSHRIKIPNYRANVRTSDGSVLGVVSGRYTIVQNKEAFQFVDGMLGEGLTYESAGSLRGGKTIWLLAKMPQTTILDDKLEPYVCFTNTHDGEGSIRVCCTPVRVVCMNTLNLALSTAKRSWSTRHIGDMQSKLQEAQHSLGLIAEYTDALKTEAERLAEMTVSDAQVEAMLDMMYPIKETDSDIRKKRVADLKNTFFACMDASDIKKYRGSAFNIINAATDYADHAQPMRLTENFDENRWGQIIVGHPFVDQIYKNLKAV